MPDHQHEPEGLTGNDFAEIVCDALGNLSVTIDRPRTICCTIGGRTLEWGYSAVIVGEVRGEQILVFPRFGEDCIVPGHIKKFLHACREQHKALRLYFAFPEDSWPDYEPLCELYGLGAITVSLTTLQAQIRLKPTRKNINRAFGTEVARITTRLKRAAKSRLSEIENRRKAFVSRAQAQGSIDDIAKHEKCFHDVTKEVQREEREIRLRLGEAQESGSLQLLREIETAIEEKIESL